LLDEGFDAAGAAHLSELLLAAIREEAQGTKDFDVLLKRLQTRFDKGVIGDAMAKWLAPVMLAGLVGGMWQVRAEVVSGGAGAPPVVNAVEPVTPSDIEGGFFLKPEKAVEWFKSKNIVSPDVFKALDDSARARAFSVSGLTENYTLEVVKDSLDEALATGQNFTTWLTKLEDTLAAAGIGTSGMSVLHWELVHVQNTSLALAAGRYVQQMRVTDVRPYWHFWNPQPVTPVCQRLEGQTFRADEFPSRYYPPNHFRCKSMILTLDADEVAAEGITVTKGDDPDLELLPVAPGFQFDPATAFFRNKGIAGLSPTPEGDAAMKALGL